MIEELQVSANKIKDMVQNLREFARPGEGRIAEFDINAGIRSAILLLWSPLRHRVVFHQELKPVPLLYGYPSEINQAIMNILRNAVEACGEQGNIWVRSYEEDGAVRVEIEDDGSGIPPELMGKIFDPFFTTKDVGSGLGLGLAIANSIVHKHGGLIEVESTPGKGSKFTLVLPLEHDINKEEAIPISTANMITKGM
jgi:signal transduction histidine kinase